MGRSHSPKPPSALRDGVIEVGHPDAPRRLLGLMPHPKMRRDAQFPAMRPRRAPSHAPVVESGGVGMSSRTAITVNRPREEVERLWRDSAYRPQYVADADAAVTFKAAPGDRGTEIHVDLEGSTAGGKLGEVVQKLVGSAPLAKVKDDLRHFKQRAETGEVPRSDGSPEGEQAERKLKQRPAQPLDESELEKVSA